MERVRKGGGLRSSNITVIFSISLVLFLLGVIGLFMVNSQRFSEYLFEQLKMNIFLEDVQFKNKPEKLEAAHQGFVDNLNLQPFTKHTRYISKEKASAEFERENQNIDIEELFNENILPASVELTLYHQYFTPKRIDSISKVLEKDPLVTEAKIDSEIVLSAYKNIEKITIWVIALSLLFLFVSIILINNYIRLRIFSKRFIIKTMQLVGAKRRFIIRPFLGEAFWLGFFGAIFAIIPLLGMQYLYSYYVQGNDSFINLFYDYRLMMIVGVVFLIGIIITVGSTLFATWRYLRLKTDQLYYF